MKDKTLLPPGCITVQCTWGVQQHECTFKVANDGTRESNQETVEAATPVKIKYTVGHGLNDGGFLGIVPSCKSPAW